LTSLRAEKVLGEGGNLNLLIAFFVDIVFTVVLCLTANLFEGGETGSSSGVGVYVQNLSALDVLEKSHCSVAGVVLNHFFVVLTLTNVIGWVLEDASLAVGALGRMLEEVFADRGQVLTAETLLLLEFILTVSEATALFLLAVLALHAHEPETAKLGLNLLFPAIFVFVILVARCGVVVVATRLMVVLVVVHAFARRAEGVTIELVAALILRVVVATSVGGADGAGTRSAHAIAARGLLTLAKREHLSLLLNVHQSVRKR
jgi:hypothetical protein